MAPRDATLSTTPLDVCLTRGVISDEAHAAATYFNALRKLVFGKAHPPAVDLTAASRGGLPDELDLPAAEENYRQAWASMKAVSANSFWAVENLVVHERWPKWLLTEGRGKLDPDRNKFCLGIAALLGWYKGRQRKAA
jgi:hypothetical protein